MGAFKRRGVLVLGVLMFIALVLVEAVKTQFGWQTGMAGNAVTAAILAGAIAFLLKRYGFHPFAKYPKS